MSCDVSFLVVEDDDVDVIALKRAFKQLKIANKQIFAGDGVEALEYLRGQGGREKIQAPYIVLLDLNMPRMSGLEFLEEIRHDQELNQSVVFVLTTSNDDRDKCSAYEKNVAGYIVKSEPTAGFLEAITMLDHYWRVVELPQQGA